MILLTGATGSIGRRLLERLEAEGRPVRCLARHPGRVRATGAATEVVRGDCLDERSLDAALAGMDTAYYLVHSLGAGARFEELDRLAADTFGRAAARAGVHRTVYLGGLGDDLHALSPHLRSRAETGAALRRHGVPVVEFRASIVVGAGSLSFEMIRALVERLPVMICPRWIDTPTQPIAVDDVVAYLVAALDLPAGEERVFEIGGADRASYGAMMASCARQRGLRRWFVRVPVLTPRLSGLWLGLVTPAQARVGRSLVEGLRNATVVRSDAARRTFPAIVPCGLDEAMARALADGQDPHLKVDTRIVEVDAAPAHAFAPIRRIGGATGWYYGSLLWTIRGWIDRAMGGVGMDRPRRDAEHCRPGDVIDGWTVVAYEPDRRLRLSADLKLPGRGWLEFEVTPLDGGRRSRIRQTATFDPRGLLGRAYWYGILPVHALMFGGLLRRLAARAAEEASAGGVSPASPPRAASHAP
jgi:uncharacterized protein YbjT (DUF2867 family)